MDRERLTELLQDPAQVAKEDLGDLRSLTERFPWFSGAHLLLAVGEHAEGDVLSNDPVRTPAAYLPSRAVLFDLIQAEGTPAPPQMHVVKDVQPVPPLSASHPLAKPAAIADLPVVVEAPPAPAEEPRSVLPDIPVGGETPALAFTPATELRMAPTIPAEEPRPVLPDNAFANSEPIAPAPPPEVPDPLESQYREAIMASGYDLSSIPALPVEPADAAPAPPLAHATLPPPPSIADPEAPVQQPVMTATRITKESRLRFTDWLTASDEAFQSPVIVAAPGASAEETRSAPAPSPIVPLASEALPDPKEIIDRFIQQATPTTTPVKAEFFTPQQAAKRSLMDDGLVSETLAKIYEQQGDIVKAKAAYARLAIIHPEKSVYFAALSKALEGRSNK